MAFQAKIAVPCCVLGVRASEQYVIGIDFLPSSHAELAPVNRLAERACRQLRDWFDEPERGFDLPLAPRGTPFQRRVWAEIAAVPPGRTRTYGEIARRLGSAARAVGQACGENPYPVVIPCHRIVAASGLGGFAHRQAGFLMNVKRWLLAHESATP